VEEISLHKKSSGRPWCPLCSLPSMLRWASCSLRLGAGKLGFP